MAKRALNLSKKDGESQTEYVMRVLMAEGWREGNDARKGEINPYENAEPTS